MITYKYERNGRIECQFDGVQFANMQLFSLLFLLGAAAFAVAAPASVTHVIHEKRESAPRTWVKRSRVDPTVLLPVRIGLRQNNLEKGHALLDEVYATCLSYARALRSGLLFSLLIMAYPEPLLNKQQSLYVWYGFSRYHATDCCSTLPSHNSTVIWMIS